MNEPSWCADIRRAAAGTFRAPSLTVWMLSVCRGIGPYDRARRLQALSDDLAAIGYRFDGAAHAIATLDEVRARGWLACADAAAILAAAATVLGSRSIIVIEAPTAGASHARLVASTQRTATVVLDPFAARRMPAARQATATMDGRAATLQHPSPLIHLPRHTPMEAINP